MMKMTTAEGTRPYAIVDKDFALESRDGQVSPMRVIREMATNAGIHGAPVMKRVFEDVCAAANRESHKRSQLKGALWNLLFALHARPRPGYELRTVEEAIDEANKVLDDLAPGASQS
jgi:hypothetical protein